MSATVLTSQKRTSYFDLVNLVKSGMLIVLDSHAFEFALSVPSHSQTLVDPDTADGWPKISVTFPAFTHIQITMAIDTGGSKNALIKKSVLNKGKRD